MRIFLIFVFLIFSLQSFSISQRINGPYSGTVLAQSTKRFLGPDIGDVNGFMVEVLNSSTATGTIWLEYAPLNSTSATGTTVTSSTASMTASGGLYQFVTSNYSPSFYIAVQNTSNATATVQLNFQSRISPK